MPEQGKCRQCGADVQWVRSGITGTLLCLDAQQVFTGRTHVIADGHACIPAAMWDELHDGPRYMEHVGTCTGKTHTRQRQ